MAEKIETALDVLKQIVVPPTVERFEQFCREAQARHGKTGQRHAGGIAAYINHSRWVADCPNCNAGIACHPGVSDAVCLECGERYRVAFPRDREGIEAVLLQRRKANRHWYPGETIDDLRRENEAHAGGD